MNCSCGAYINKLWKICQICGAGIDKQTQIITQASFEVIKQYAGDGWHEIEKDPEILKAFASAISDITMREKGLIPDDYTSTTICKNCGEVPISPALANNGNVLGCPWCFNRAKGLPIPNHNCCSDQKEIRR